MIEIQYMGFWTSPAEDDDHVRWLRESYDRICAETGGVPAGEGAPAGHVERGLVQVVLPGLVCWAVEVTPRSLPASTR